MSKTKTTEANPVTLRLEIYKGKRVPSKKKGAKIYTITARTKQETIKEAYAHYQTTAEYNDVTINGAILAKDTFGTAESYQTAVIMFCNLVIEHKINPLKYYEGIELPVAVELEKLRLAGHDLRDHFRGPDVTYMDVLADAPGIIQNAQGSGRVH